MVHPLAVSKDETQITRRATRELSSPSIRVLPRQCYRLMCRVPHYSKCGDDDAAGVWNNL
jgi:hypothetical protein